MVSLRSPERRTRIILVFYDLFYDKYYAKILKASIFCLASSIVLIAAAPVLGMTSHMANESTYGALYDLVDRVGAKPPVNNKDAERLIRVRLTLVSENVFFRYEAQNAHFKDLSIALVDYRESPDGAATTGSFLGITFGNNCLSRNEILSHFNVLILSGVPSGHSLDELIEYSQTTHWGRLGFGFSEQFPNCLRSVTFIFNPRKAGN